MHAAQTHRSFSARLAPLAAVAAFAWGSAARAQTAVVPVPADPADPTVPHEAYNGHPTTFKAISRGGCESPYFRWDVDGDGRWDSCLDRVTARPTGAWYQDNRYRLDCRQQLPDVDPSATRHRLYVGTIEVACSVAADGVPTGSVFGTYLVKVDASVPRGRPPSGPYNTFGYSARPAAPAASCQSGTCATTGFPCTSNAECVGDDDLSLDLKRRVAIGDAMWFGHKLMARGGEGVNTITANAENPAGTGYLLWLLGENGRVPAFPPGTYAPSCGAPPAGFGAANDRLYALDPYAEDAARLFNYLTGLGYSQYGAGGAPESDDGTTPIPGTNDGIGLWFDTSHTLGPMIAGISTVARTGICLQTGPFVGRSAPFFLQQLVDGAVMAQVKSGLNQGAWYYTPFSPEMEGATTQAMLFGLSAARRHGAQVGAYLNQEVRYRIPFHLIANQRANGSGCGVTYLGYCYDPHMTGALLQAHGLLGVNNLPDTSATSFAPLSPHTNATLLRAYSNAEFFLVSTWFAAASGSMGWNGTNFAYPAARFDGLQMGNIYAHQAIANGVHELRPYHRYLVADDNANGLVDAGDANRANDVDWWTDYTYYNVNNQQKDGAWLQRWCTWASPGCGYAGPGILTSWSALVLTLIAQDREKDLGAPCTSDAACYSGRCVDGVCCDSICWGTCHACDVPGKLGTCSPVEGAPHGNRGVCPPDANGCTDERCDGAGACASFPNTLACNDGDACTRGDVCGAGACTGVAYSCDDGDGCTNDVCNGDGTCQHPFNTAPCDDAQACTRGDACLLGVCTGTRYSCDDSNVCTDETCNGDGTCARSFNTGGCDDGAPCTRDDVCSGGACAGVAYSCADADVCTDDVCNGDGTCGHPFNSATCDDGAACTFDDRCALGACAGTRYDCDDSDLCTDDACRGDGSCAHTANTAPCDDADACTRDDVCGGGTCGGTRYSCDDGDPCTDDVCNGDGTCGHPFNTASCDDGAACTFNDVCRLGVCAGSAYGCDDADVCTDDACNGDGTCRHSDNASPCDDGAACTSGDVCAGGVCAGTAYGCDDGNVCTDDACNGDGTCRHADNVAPCDDGAACTRDDRCGAGACTGTSYSCDDGNVCTDDTCNGDGSCARADNTAACDDGAACTAHDVCAGGVCAGAAYGCDDGNVCSDDVCNGDGTCSHPANAAPCDDGDPCTAADVCGAGACAGTAYSCDDADPCTDDVCNADGTCAHPFNTAPCDDGQGCTRDDTCALGVCAGAAYLCDDGDVCTDEVCNGDGTCSHAFNTAPCEDLDPCTAGDTCSAGACVGAPYTCEDGNPCTDGVCLGDGTCSQLANSAACDDGDACTSGDTCSAGACGGSAYACDDANPCTDDACNGDGTCGHTDNGASCDDGEACTSADVCAAGTCAGAAYSCDDGNACTEDACQGDGTCSFSFTAGTCDDGDACTQDDHCTSGECHGAVYSCDDGNACTDDSCSGDGTCGHAFNAGPCDDGQACTKDDVCTQGVCGGTAYACDDGDPCTADRCDGAGACGHDPIAECCLTDAACDDGEGCTNDACDLSTHRCTHVPGAACGVGADGGGGAAAPEAGCGCGSAGGQGLLLVPGLLVLAFRRRRRAGWLVATAAVGASTLALAGCSGSGGGEAAQARAALNGVLVSAPSVRPAFAPCGVDMVFDGSASSPAEPARKIVRYAWDFDTAVDSSADGNPANDVDALGAQVTYRYARMAFTTPGGVFTVLPHRASLTVTDDLGATATATVEATLAFANTRPVAVAGGPYPTTLLPSGATAPFNLVGGASYDPDAPCDAIAEYAWDTDNDGLYGAADLNGSALCGTTDCRGATVSGLSFPSSGLGRAYRVALRVTDAYGQVSDPAETMVQVVANPPPTLVLVQPNGGEILRGTADVRLRIAQPQGKVVNLSMMLNGSPIPFNGPSSVATPLNGTLVDVVRTINTAAYSNARDFYRLTVTAALVENASISAAASSRTPFTIDNAAPALTLPAGELAPVLQCVAPTGTPFTFHPVVTDSLDPAPRLAVSPSLTQYPLGTTNVVFTGTDWAGNVTTRSVAVRVQDTVAPQLTAGPNLTAEAVAPGGTPVALAPAASDACDAQVAITSDAPPSGFLVGATLVTFTATDDSGNRATGTNTVTITDTTPPTLALSPAGVSLQQTQALGVPASGVSLPLPSLSDNGTVAASIRCGIAVELRNAQGAAVAPPVGGYACGAPLPAGVYFPEGTTVATYTVRDLAGNASSATFTVSVTALPVAVASASPMVQAEACPRASPFNEVTFDHSASHHLSATRTLRDFRWLFDVPAGSEPAFGDEAFWNSIPDGEYSADGKAFHTGDPAATPVHSYPRAGTYHAALLVVDDGAPALTRVARVSGIEISALPDSDHDGLPDACECLEVTCAAQDDCHEAGQCDPATGACSNPARPDASPCDDGNACTTGDACIAGACFAIDTSASDCDDHNACTDDTCDAARGCINTAHTRACDDGDACTGGDVCSLGTCAGADASAACDDHNACTDDACDSSVGCVNAFHERPCDDANACTTDDACLLGACAGRDRPAADCDDQNACTDDACDAARGCVHVAHQRACDDGDACTTGDACSQGACAGVDASAACDDANVCTDDSCDSTSGCVHVNHVRPCDDGNACTTGDACSEGACAAVDTSGVDCDDANPCTADSCAPASGCAHVVQQGACDDGDACTSGDTCTVEGRCAGEPVGPSFCEDGNPCTDDACEPERGCVHANREGACDDGDACTTEQCVDGACSASPLDCADQDPCTSDVCVADQGCMHPLDASCCSAAHPCAADQACRNGACLPVLCTECAVDEDCGAPGARCTFIANGRFCAPACEEGVCATGSACVAQQGGASVCLPEAGLCRCIEPAVPGRCEGADWIQLDSCSVVAGTEACARGCVEPEGCCPEGTQASEGVCAEVEPTPDGGSPDAAAPEVRDAGAEELADAGPATDAQGAAPAPPGADVGGGGCGCAGATGPAFPAGLVLALAGWARLRRRRRPQIARGGA